MKMHTRKKLVRAEWRALAKKGLINGPDGKWIPRGSANAMHRDFSPQRS